MGNLNSSQGVAALKVAARSKTKSKQLESSKTTVIAAAPPTAVPEKVKATNPTTSTSTTLASPPARAWWKESSVYQVYPSSFYDSNGDGVGDIQGIIEKLDYLKLLGVDIVWLSPVYKSPQFDMGYDISDYRAIHPPYGTMEDLDRLIEGVHDRGMKFVMDLVVNHTSDQHDWFKESRSSSKNPKRDWYIWRDPVYDEDGKRQPPNNWASIFGGSSWTFDEETGQYYLHLFCKEQPDLNWENPDVVQTVHDIMRFWLDKGTDGFRMDVINLVSKTPGLPDAPITLADQKYQPADLHYAFGPRLHEHLRELRKVLDEYDAFAVGEMPWVKEQNHVLETVSSSRKELNMIFQFDIVDMDIGAGGKFTARKWTLKDLKAIVGKWQTSMFDAGGWNALFVENHDQPRSVTRWACDEPEFRAHAAKMLATFVGLQSGTPYIYQGQELGMANSPMDWERKEYKDIETQNMWTSAVERFGDNKELMDEFYQELHLKARDHARTPLQWNKQKHAGFTTGTPWMRVNDDYTQWNAEQQIPDPNSVFVYWQNILRLRKHQKNIFVYGSFEMVDNDHESVFAYRRSNESSSATVVLNFSKKETKWAAPDRVLESLTRGDLVLNTHPRKGRIEANKEILLRPFEALVWINGNYV